MAKFPKFEMGHIGVNVTDIDGMTEFYRRVLGFTVTDGGKLRDMRLAFLSRDPGHHHQIVFVTGRPPGTATTINQISFKVASLDDLRTYHEALLAADVEGIDPVDHGNAWSIYFLDPEGNRLEVFMDTPWYVKQPKRETLDFALSDEEINQATIARFGDDETFRPVEDWRDEVRKVIA